MIFVFRYAVENEIDYYVTLLVNYFLGIAVKTNYIISCFVLF